MITAFGWSACLLAVNRAAEGPATGAGGAVKGDGFTTYWTKNGIGGAMVAHRIEARDETESDEPGA